MISWIQFKEYAMDIYNEDLFIRFIEENPLRFSAQRMAIARKDFYGHRHGTASDEFADYVLWAEKSPARHEHFGAFLLPLIKENGWCAILEVGCGETALLSEYLYQELGDNVTITAMDQCDIKCGDPSVKIIKHKFTGTENLAEYDAVIAQEPCEAAELIVKACTEQNVPYCVILCGVPHTRLTGVLDDDVYDWYAYLLSTYPNSKFTKWYNGRFSSGCIYSENMFNKK